ncbi:hypothetical protein ACQKWADRAFT_114360 [Trichoderma austrokoningii]
MHVWTGSLPRYWPTVMDTSLVRGRRGCRHYAICVASCVSGTNTQGGLGHSGAGAVIAASLWAALLKTYMKATNTRPFIPLFSFVLCSGAGLPLYFLIPLSRFHLHQKTLQLPITPQSISVAGQLETR